MRSCVLAACPKSPFFALGSSQNIISLHAVLCGSPKSWGAGAFVPTLCSFRQTLAWDVPGAGRSPGGPPFLCSSCSAACVAAATPFCSRFNGFLPYLPRPTCLGALSPSEAGTLPVRLRFHPVRGESSPDAGPGSGTTTPDAEQPSVFPLVRFCRPQTVLIQSLLHSSS